MEDEYLDSYWESQYEQLDGQDDQSIFFEEEDFEDDIIDFDDDTDDGTTEDIDFPF